MHYLGKIINLLVQNHGAVGEPHKQFIQFEKAQIRRNTRSTGSFSVTDSRGANNVKIRISSHNFIVVLADLFI